MYLFDVLQIICFCHEAVAAGAVPAVVGATEEWFVFARFDNQVAIATFVTF